MTIRAYSYIRFSTVEQRKGDSLRRQLKRTEEYAAKHGLVLDDRSFRDLGVSAFTGENVETGRLAEFLEAVRVGSIEKGSYLLIENLDRLSRQSARKALNILGEIVSQGIVVVTMTDEKRYDQASIDDTMTLLMAAFTFARANEESQRKADLVGAAWKKKKTDAVEFKKPLTRRCPAWLEIENGEYKEIKERADVVRRIFEDTARGLGSSAIVRQLNGERINGKGIPPFGKGREWQRSYITKLLHNDAVLGRYRPHSKARKGKRTPTGEVVEAYYPETVTPRLWQDARAARTSRRNRAAGRRSLIYKNLFTGLCKCGACGGSMELRDKGPLPKGGVYLTCASALRGGACDERTHYPYSVLEQRFLDHVRNIDFPAIQLETSFELKRAQSKVAEIEQKVLLLQERKNGFLEDYRRSGDGAVWVFIEDIRKEEGEYTIELERHVETVKKLTTQEKTASYDYIVRMRQKINESEGVELYNARAELAQAIRSVVACITFYPEFSEVAIDTPRSGIGYRFMSDGEVKHVLAQKSLAPALRYLIEKDAQR